MKQLALQTTRLELRPLPSAAARALPDDRETAARLLGAALSADWPQPDLLDVLPMQAAAEQSGERFGVWVIIERESTTVVGDIGFMGPPGEDGGVEIGYCVIPDRRGRGYASEAVAALVAWALAQPGVGSVAARCDVRECAVDPRTRTRGLRPLQRERRPDPLAARSELVARLMTGVSVWTDPLWLAGAHEWIREQLARLGARRCRGDRSTPRSALVDGDARADRSRRRLLQGKHRRASARGRARHDARRSPTRLRAAAAGGRPRARVDAHGRRR